jgi:hypothetical protein
VGETQKRRFQLSFNSSLRVDFQGARVTSDSGLILVRELDDRVGLSEWYLKSGRSSDIGIATAPPETGSAGDHAITPASRTLPPTHS